MSPRFFDQVYAFFTPLEKNDSSFLSYFKNHLWGTMPNEPVKKQPSPVKVTPVKKQSTANNSIIPVPPTIPIAPVTIPIDPKKIITLANFPGEIDLTLDTLNKVPNIFKFCVIPESPERNLLRKKNQIINYFKQRFDCFSSSSHPIRHPEAVFYLHLCHAIKQAENYSDICIAIVKACKKLKEFEENIANPNVDLITYDILNQTYELYPVNVSLPQKEKKLKNALKTRHDMTETAHYSDTHYYSYTPLIEHCERLLSNMTLDLYRAELTQALNQKTKRTGCWDLFMNWLCPPKLTAQDIRAIGNAQNSSRLNFTKP